MKEEFVLPDRPMGRSLSEHIIPTVCGVKNMLESLKEQEGDSSRLKTWEKRSYRSYLIDEIQPELMAVPLEYSREVLRVHILDHVISDFGPNVIDIYLVAYVAQTYGKGRDTFLHYVEDSGISQKSNSANAIWQVGKGDGVFLGILNVDGGVQDWSFMQRWLRVDKIGKDFSQN